MKRDIKKKTRTSRSRKDQKLNKQTKQAKQNKLAAFTLKKEKKGFFSFIIYTKEKDKVKYMLKN